jgi:hypothetical protein
MPSQPQPPPSAAAAARMAQRLRTAVSAGQWDMLAAILRVLPAEQVPLALRAAADWASATGSQRAAQPAPAAQAPAAGVPVSSAATATRRRGCRGGRGRKQQPTVVAAGPPAAPAERAPSPPGQGRAMEVEELAGAGLAAQPPAHQSAAMAQRGGLRQDQPTDSGMGVAAVAAAAPSHLRAPAPLSAAAPSQSGLRSGFFREQRPRKRQQLQPPSGSTMGPPATSGALP